MAYSFHCRLPEGEQPDLLGHSARIPVLRAWFVGTTPEEAQRS
jgi:hypothetical protein